MARHKHTDAICIVMAFLTAAITIAFIFGESFGLVAAHTVPPYAAKLFDTQRVHTIDIVADPDDWQNMLDTAASEQYIMATVVINGEKVGNVGIRPKGNSSLSSITRSDSDRYSFKIEFDHYVGGRSYYGLDKLALNNIAQDNTYLKDYVSYQMMLAMDAYAPLCSFAWITVNGEDWGLYLAVEGVEESFAARNFGSDYGEIYKPDSMDMNRGADENQFADREQNGAMPNFSQWEGGEVPDFSQWGDGTIPNFNPADGGALPGSVPADGGALPGFNPADGGALPGSVPADGGALPGSVPADGGASPGAVPADGGFEQRQGRDSAASGDNTGTADPSQNAGGRQGAMNRPATDGEGGFADFGNREAGMGGGMGGMMGGFGSSGDTSLIYTDDQFSSYSNIFENAAFSPSDADKESLIEALKRLNEGDPDSSVDIDKVIRYFVVHNFVLNSDSYTGNLVHNYYLHENNGILSMIAWDYNLAFGGMGGGMGGASSDSATSMVNYPIDDPLLSGTMESRPMIAWIFDNPDYTALYHEYFARFVEYFDNGGFAAMFDSAVDLISPYVEKDPSAFCTYEQFLTAAATLREFCVLRAQSIGGQLNGAIPSTSAGQTADPSSLINASHVDTSSMGSNNMGFDRARR